MTKNMPMAVEETKHTVIQSLTLKKMYSVYANT